MITWQLDEKMVGALSVVFDAACKAAGMQLAPTCVVLAQSLQQAVQASGNGRRPQSTGLEGSSTAPADFNG